MEVKDMVGMMSTGALLALGLMFVVDKLGAEQSVAPQMVATVANTQQQVNTALPAQQPVATEGATRVDIDLLSQSTASRIGRIVALSQQGLSQTETLTPEQEEIITFFERTAREMNQQDKSASMGHVKFSNMAVRGLNVRYFYRVPQAFGEVNTASLLISQNAKVRRTLCENSAIRTLLTDYGFAYTYTYVSEDSRKLGEISADAAICV